MYCNRISKGGVWGCLALELLDNVKAMLEQSEGKDDRIIGNAMKKLQLVNHHWSSWATRAIGVLRPPADVPLETLVEVLAKRFLNVRNLKQDKIKKIDDEYLFALCKLSTLTVLDVTVNMYFCSREITDRGASSLASLSALKELHFINRDKITNVGM